MVCLRNICINTLNKGDKNDDDDDNNNNNNKPERKGPLGRPRHRWEDNIKMDLQDVECWVLDRIELARDRDRWWAIVNAVMNFGVP